MWRKIFPWTISWFYSFHHQTYILQNLFNKKIPLTCSTVVFFFPFWPYSGQNSMILSEYRSRPLSTSRAMQTAPTAWNINFKSDLLISFYSVVFLAGTKLLRISKEGIFADMKKRNKNSLIVYNFKNDAITVRAVRNSKFWKLLNRNPESELKLAVTPESEFRTPLITIGHWKWFSN